MKTFERSWLKNVARTLLGLLAILLVLGFAIFGEEAMSTLTHSNRNCAEAAGLVLPNSAALRSTANPDCAASGAAAIGFVTGSGLAAHLQREPGAFLLFAAGITGFVYLSVRRRNGRRTPEPTESAPGALYGGAIAGGHASTIEGGREA
jgi:hypothetical protein